MKREKAWNTAIALVLKFLSCRETVGLPVTKQQDK